MIPEHQTPKNITTTEKLSRGIFMVLLQQILTAKDAPEWTDSTAKMTT